MNPLESIFSRMPRNCLKGGSRHRALAPYLLRQMMRLTRLMALTALIFLYIACAATPSASPTLTAFEVADSETLIHLFLEREHRLAVRLGVSDANAEYARAREKLESFLRRAEAEIYLLPAGKQPKDVLLAIERAMIAEDFVFQQPTITLSEMLIASSPSPYIRHLTEERRKHFESTRPSRVYRFDCDTGSLLYMAVAERVGLPLKFVEVPNHNFVRWVDSNGVTLNWDVNEATTYTDQQYQKTGTRTASPQPISDWQRAHFLVSFTRREIEGYHHYMLALMARWAGHMGLAEQHYLESINLRPAAPRSKNNLAWIWSVHPSFPSAVYGARAVLLAEQAVAAVPEELNYLTTLSCALAAAGRFNDAAQVEKRARNDASRLERYARREDCRGSASF